MILLSFNYQIYKIQGIMHSSQQIIQQQFNASLLFDKKQTELQIRNSSQLYQNIIQPLLREQESLEKVFNSSLTLSTQKVNSCLLSYKNLIRFQKALKVYSIDIQNILIETYLKQKQRINNIQISNSNFKESILGNVEAVLKLAFRKSSTATSKVIQLISSISCQQQVALILSSAQNQETSILICRSSLQNIYFRIFEKEILNNKTKTESQFVYLNQLLESILPTIQIQQLRFQDQQYFTKIYQLAIQIQILVRKLTHQILFQLKSCNSISNITNQRRIPLQFCHLWVFLLKWYQKNINSVRKFQDPQYSLNAQSDIAVWTNIFLLSTTINKSYHSDILSLIQFVSFPREINTQPQFKETFLNFNIGQQHTITINSFQDLKKYINYLNRLVEQNVQPNLYRLISSIQYILVFGLNEGNQVFQIISNNQRFQVLVYEKFVRQNIFTKTSLFLLKNTLKSLFKNNRKYLINLQVLLFQQINKFFRGKEGNNICFEIYAYLNTILFLETPDIKQKILEIIQKYYPSLLINFQKREAQQVNFNFDKRIFHLYLENRTNKQQFFNKAFLFMNSQYLNQFWLNTFKESRNNLRGLSLMQTYVKIMYGRAFNTQQKQYQLSTKLSQQMLSSLFFSIYSQNLQIVQKSLTILQYLVQLTQYLEKQIFSLKQITSKIYKAINFYEYKKTTKYLIFQILFTLFVVLKRKAFQNRMYVKYQEIKEILNMKKQTKILHNYFHDSLIEYSFILQNHKQGLYESTLYSRSFKLLFIGLYSYLSLTDQSKQFQMLQHIYRKSTEILANLYIKIVLNSYAQIEFQTKKNSVSGIKRQAYQLQKSNEVQSNLNIDFEKLLNTDQTQLANIFQSCQAFIILLNKKYSVEFVCPKLHKAKQSQSSSKLQIRMIFSVKKNI